MRRLLLVFGLLQLVFSTIHINDLKYHHDLVNEKTILRDHMKIKDQSTVKSVPTLAYISDENPHGYSLVERTARRLTFVAPAWFTVSLRFEKRDGVNVVVPKINGRKNVKMNFIQSVLKENPQIHIVPVVKFDEMTPQTVEVLVNENVHMKIIAAELTSFVNNLKFDGLVIDIYNVLMVHRDRGIKSKALEAMATLGESFRDAEYISILPISPPFKTRYSNDPGDLGSEECSVLTGAFDFVQLNTFDIPMVFDTTRDWQPWAVKNVERCGSASNLMLGVNFHGFEFVYTEFKRNSNENVKIVDGEEYIKTLEDGFSDLTYAAETTSFQLFNRFDNRLIFFPSLTSIEYRQQIIRELGLSMAIYDYGMGLDYFTNLI